ncbi:hypothetical protein [Nannocystis radixulma]|uniref:Uncharacterized protein n=1 Tax=Nannocystis radixulma TaxID=2995305 RepID=A0ABT5B306_9BACT|nr:hypothetical protein [Nannocystis radixulma]MDC0668475.1 hypothetical protein [Nannocystis radixulma]
MAHVIDAPDPATAPPAAAVTNRDEYVSVGDTLMVTGCARAQPGSTLNAYWGVVPPAGESFEWVAFVTGAPLAGPTREVLLRIDVTDPQQRTFRAYPGQELAILGVVGSYDHNFVDCGGDGGADSEGVRRTPTIRRRRRLHPTGPRRGTRRGVVAARRPRAAPLRPARCCWPWWVPTAGRRCEDFVAATDVPRDSCEYAGAGARSNVRRG